MCSWEEFRKVEWKHWSSIVRATLTRWHSADHIKRDFAGFTLSSLVDGRHSELVNVAFSQTTHLQCGVQMSPISVHLHPSSTLSLTPLHQVVNQSAATITLWLQPLNSGKVLSWCQDLWSSRGRWHRYSEGRVWNVVIRCCLQILYQWLTVALTESVSGNYRLWLEVNSRSILVHSPDSEKVLCVFEKSSDLAGQLFALCMHNDPVESVGIASLHHVMRDLISTIFKRRLPPQSAGLLSDIDNLNVAFTYARSI